MSDDGERDEPHPMSDHVLVKIGLHAGAAGAACGEGLHLHLSPLLLEPDGHLDFGVLGVYLDLASSLAGEMVPFVHSDISINRIAPPAGEVISVEATSLRAGKRTGVVHVAAHDETGVRIADSTQQIVFMAPSMDGVFDVHDPAERRRKFFAPFDGVCKLSGRLHDIIGIERESRPDGDHWTMPNTAASRNGWGGLHGGVAFDLVTEAASGAAGSPDIAAEAKSAFLRYLAPAVTGPFRAVPTVLPQGDGAVFVRVDVHDDGNDGRLCIVGEVHLVQRA